jgi:ABC-type multidrug transport system ATPase subunit
LFTEPNVLILDEPTNDLDTDMLAAMEDLLDTWPGTMIVVSHDRYLLERVTDQQYAILGDGKVRHLTRGIDQFLELRKAMKPSSEPVKVATSSGLSGAERRNLEKELGRLDRAVKKGKLELEALNLEFSQADQSNYELLGTLSAKQSKLAAEIAINEDLWLETSTKLEG